MPKVPELSHCCCRYQLRSGILWIGYSTLVLGVLQFIAHVGQLIDMDATEVTYAEIIHRLGGRVPDAPFLRNLLFATSIVALILCTGFVGSAICMLRGVKTRNRKLLIPWLVVTLLAVGYVLVSAMFTVFFVPVMVIPQCLLIALFVYAIWCVYSFYHRGE